MQSPHSKQINQWHFVSAQLREFYIRQLKIDSLSHQLPAMKDYFSALRSWYIRIYRSHFAVMKIKWTVNLHGCGWKLQQHQQHISNSPLLFTLFVSAATDTKCVSYKFFLLSHTMSVKQWVVSEFLGFRGSSPWYGHVFIFSQSWDVRKCCGWEQVKSVLPF